MRAVDGRRDAVRANKEGRFQTASSPTAGWRPPLLGGHDASTASRPTQERDSTGRRLFQTRRGAFQTALFSDGGLETAAPWWPRRLDSVSPYPRTRLDGASS